MLASVGSVGDAYDNALAESFVDSFKTELIADRVWRTYARGSSSPSSSTSPGLNYWTRLHSSLGNIPPTEHEQRHAAALAADPEAPLLLPSGSVTLNVSGVYDPFGLVSDLRYETSSLT